MNICGVFEGHGRIRNCEQRGLGMPGAGGFGWGVAVVR
jgi:hypothetical protein